VFLIPFTLKRSGIREKKRPWSLSITIILLSIATLAIPYISNKETTENDSFKITLLVLLLATRVFFEILGRSLILNFTGIVSSFKERSRLAGFFSVNMYISRFVGPPIFANLFAISISDFDSYPINSDNSNVGTSGAYAHAFQAIVFSSFLAFIITLFL
jgi:hypothetical protein